MTTMTHETIYIGLAVRQVTSTLDVLDVRFLGKRERDIKREEDRGYYLGNDDFGNILDIISISQNVSYIIVGVP